MRITEQASMSPAEMEHLKAHINPAAWNWSTPFIVQDILLQEPNGHALITLWGCLNWLLILANTHDRGHGVGMRELAYTAHVCKSTAAAGVDRLVELDLVQVVGYELADGRPVSSGVQFPDDPTPDDKFYRIDTNTMYIFRREGGWHPEKRIHPRRRFAINITELEDRSFPRFIHAVRQHGKQAPLRPSSPDTQDILFANGLPGGGSSDDQGAAHQWDGAAHQWDASAHPHSDAENPPDQTESGSPVGRGGSPVGRGGSSDDRTDGTGREKNGWVRHTGENFDDSASERLTNVHEADIRQIMQAILHEMRQLNLQPYTNNGGGRQEIHNSDDAIENPLAAVPDAPAGEDPLVESLASLWMTLSFNWSPLMGKHPDQELLRLRILAKSIDKDTGGYGEYWVCRAIMDADQVAFRTPEKAPVYGVAYVDKIVQRWKRDRSWGSPHPAMEVGAEMQSMADFQADGNEQAADGDEQAAGDTQHQAVLIYRETFGISLSAAHAHRIEEVVPAEDEALKTWRGVLDIWKGGISKQGHPYNPRNVESILQRFEQDWKKRQREVRGKPTAKPIADARRQGLIDGDEDYRWSYTAWVNCNNEADQWEVLERFEAFLTERRAEREAARAERATEPAEPRAAPTEEGQPDESPVVVPAEPASEPDEAQQAQIEQAQQAVQAMREQALRAREEASKQTRVAQWAMELEDVMADSGEYDDMDGNDGQGEEPDDTLSPVPEPEAPDIPPETEPEAPDTTPDESDGSPDGQDGAPDMEAPDEQAAPPNAPDEPAPRAQAVATEEEEPGVSAPKAEGQAVGSVPAAGGAAGEAVPPWANPAAPAWEVGRRELADQMARIKQTGTGHQAAVQSATALIGDYLQDTADTPLASFGGEVAPVPAPASSLDEAYEQREARWNQERQRAFQRRLNLTDEQFATYLTLREHDREALEAWMQAWRERDGTDAVDEFLERRQQGWASGFLPGELLPLAAVAPDLPASEQQALQAMGDETLLTDQQALRAAGNPSGFTLDERRVWAADYPFPFAGGVAAAAALPDAFPAPQAPAHLMACGVAAADAICPIWLESISERDVVAQWYEGYQQFTEQKAQQRVPRGKPKKTEKKKNKKKVMHGVNTEKEEHV